MLQLTNQQFEDLKRRYNPEVYTEEQLNRLVYPAAEAISKAENKEDELIKAGIDELNEEISSLTQIQVVSPGEGLSKGLKYETLYIREQQVEWDADEIVKSEDGKDEIIKARGGVYKDTAYNRKQGRVGQRFGEKKEPESKEKEEGKEPEKKDEHEVSFKNQEGTESKRTIRIGNVSPKEALDWAKEHIKGSDFKIV
jgi:hypothetical protein